MRITTALFNLQNSQTFLTEIPLSGILPVRSDIWKFFLFLVRFGPRVQNFAWSWSGPVQVLKLLFVLVRSEIPGFGSGSIGFGRWIREGNASNWYGWVYFRLYSGKVSNFWISKKKSINLIFYQKITPVAIIWATYAMRGRRYLQKYSSICG